MEWGRSQRYWTLTLSLIGDSYLSFSCVGYITLSSFLDSSCLAQKCQLSNPQRVVLIVPVLFAGTWRLVRALLYLQLTVIWVEPQSVVLGQVLCAQSFGKTTHKGFHQTVLSRVTQMGAFQLMVDLGF